MKNRTASGPDSIRLENLNRIPQNLANTLSILFTRYPLECKLYNQQKTTRIVLHKNWYLFTMDNNALSTVVVYMTFTSVIIDRIGRTIGEVEPWKQAEFRKVEHERPYIHGRGTHEGSQSISRSSTRRRLSNKLELKQLHIGLLDISGYFVGCTAIRDKNIYHPTTILCQDDD